MDVARMNLVVPIGMLALIDAAAADSIKRIIDCS